MNYIAQIKNQLESMIEAENNDCLDAEDFNDLRELIDNWQYLK